MKTAKNFTTLCYHFPHTLCYHHHSDNTQQKDIFSVVTLQLCQFSIKITGALLFCVQ